MKPEERAAGMAAIRHSRSLAGAKLEGVSRPRKSLYDAIDAMPDPEDALNEEREACAKLAETFWTERDDPYLQQRVKAIAAAIRARGAK